MISVRTTFRSLRGNLLKSVPWSGARYHLIGHLQSNKAKIATELFDVIQTVDSPKLAQRIGAAGKSMEVMIEVKLSAEESKAGRTSERPSVIDAVRSCSTSALTGLMTMPPWSEDAELSRPYFRRLHQLAVKQACSVSLWACRTTSRLRSKKGRLIYA